MKLPKLVITKFDDTSFDWFRSCNQFESEIDKAEIGLVSKFSYLKELLIPRVRLPTDGLPFTFEGYSRAKPILLRMFVKSTRIADAHIQCITSLPVIQNSYPNRLHDFYEKLVISVSPLDTMNKLKEINGYVRLTLDKLSGIRADLVRIDEDWQEWTFPQFVDVLKKWTTRNSKILPSPEKSFKRENTYQTNYKIYKHGGCVYCEKSGHKASDCKTVSDIKKRRLTLSNKKLCFNYTGTKHRASECLSNRSCVKCKRKHHSSICDKITSTLLTTSSCSVTYPVVLIEIEAVKYRALIDTGAEASYASSTLPIQTEIKKTETLMSTNTRKIKIYSVKTQDINCEFNFETELNHVEKEVLLELLNPKYRELQKIYIHLKNLQINDYYPKSELPVHVILDISDYTKIKTQDRLRVGLPGEPIVELTKFGLVIVST